MPDDNPPTLESAVQVVTSFLKHMSEGDVQALKALIADEDEDGSSVQTLRDGETMSYQIGEPQNHQDMVVVPVDMTFEFEGESDQQQMPFAVVGTETGLKINMAKTFEVLTGADPEQLMDEMAAGMSEIMEDIQDSVESANDDVIDTSAETDDSFEAMAMEDLPQEFLAGLEAVEHEWSSAIATIHECLGKDPEWQFDWGSMPWDEHCGLRLFRSVISPLGAALKSMQDMQSPDNEESSEAPFEKVKAAINTIRIRNIGQPALCRCTLRDGRLEIDTALEERIVDPQRAAKEFEEDEIRQALCDELDLMVGPAFKQSQADVAPLEEAEELAPDTNDINSDDDQDLIRSQIDQMTESMVGTMSQQIDELLGREMPMHVDMNSMGLDMDRVILVVTMGFASVVGALMVMLYDPELKDTVAAAIREMHFRYDETLAAPQLSLDDGHLSFAIGGSSTDFAPDHPKMVADIKALL